MFLIKNRKSFLWFALVLILVSIVIIAKFGFRFGIDFTGGSLTEVVYKNAPQKEVVASRIKELDLGAASVRKAVTKDGNSAFLIRTRDLNDAERQNLIKTLTSLGEGGEISRFTSIGPAIGSELRDKAGWAIFGVSAIIIIYVAFAFSGIGVPVSSWVYGFITILILMHDILIPTAAISLLGYLKGVEIDVLFVTALLAVLGYSVNDTIVIFDRIREILKKHRQEHRKKISEVAGIVKEEVTYTLKKPFTEIVGEAVDKSLSRSINTSLTTILTLSALWWLGGSTTQMFALILLIGVLAGTYSSIAIASPLLVTYALWKDESKGKNK